MKQVEATKQDYISKLKKELDVIEEKWLLINNENIMIGEDYRSKALEFLDKTNKLNTIIFEKNESLISKDQKINQLICKLDEKEEYIERQTMYSEDLLAQMWSQDDKRADLEDNIS